MENHSNRILIHTCCAPCSAGALLHLKDQFDITFFFYNPNIFPESEYEKRRDEMIRISEKEDFPLLIGSFDHDKWKSTASQWADEPEKGKRCLWCYKERLIETAIHAKMNDFKFFATTLTLSPHKDADAINKIGNEVAKEYDIEYVETNLKKKGGHGYSIEYSKENNLFRQNYCGCEFSKAATQVRNKQESPSE
jgi:epoxyqueuosine reductase